MTTTTPTKDWMQIHQFLREVPDNELGALFKEYIEESAHQGFDGFTSHDVTGIRRMLVDFIVYWNNRG